MPQDYHGTTRHDGKLKKSRKNEHYPKRRDDHNGSRRGNDNNIDKNKWDHSWIPSVSLAIRSPPRRNSLRSSCISGAHSILTAGMLSSTATTSGKLSGTSLSIMTRRRAKKKTRRVTLGITSDTYGSNNGRELATLHQCDHPCGHYNNCGGAPGGRPCISSATARVLCQRSPF